jgi:hypothetical protein
LLLALSLSCALAAKDAVAAAKSSSVVNPRVVASVTSLDP